MTDLSEILAEFTNASRRVLGLSDLNLIFREEWGSHAADHRRLIREAIAQNTPCDPVKILDLDRLPTLEHGSVSIAHCRTLGGYAWTSSRGLLGVDVEEAGRLGPAAIARVSTPVELQNCPDQKFLWVAKEAGFKALAAATGVPTVSEVVIDNWNPAEGRSKDFWSFRAQFGATSTTGLASGNDGQRLIAVVFNSPRTFLS